MVLDSPNEDVYTESIHYDRHVLQACTLECLHHAPSAK